MGDKIGYHKVFIPKGVYGEASKVTEEAMEFKDAIDQGCEIMALLELADLYGAMEAYVSRRGFTMDDVKRMSDITTRAFVNGVRK